MSLLEVHDLDAGYLEQLVVRGASIKVETGELVALIGPNGAGKSTLLNAIAGLVKPSAGRVLLNGRDITAMAPEDGWKLGVAYVPQVRNIFPSLTVLETLEVCHHRGNAKRAIQEILEDFPQLKRRLGTRAGLLSGGERQMLALSTALVNRPFELILMDEPSAGVSVDNVRTIFERIHSLQDRGTTILMVEQNAVKSLEICDRAYVLEGGRVAAHGTGEELRSSNVLKNIFLGVADNLKSGSH